MILLGNRLIPNSGKEVPITKGQVTEEPCDEKLSRTVLKGRCDWRQSHRPYPVKCEPIRETGTGAIGVDFGTLTAIAMSDGTKIENPRFLAATAEKIRVTSKQKRRKRAPNFKKKVKASKRWKKAQSKVSKLQRKAANQRQDWGQKITTQIVSCNSMVVTEKLTIKGMTKKPKMGKPKRQKSGLNRSILDVGWGILAGMLEYKLVEAEGIFLEAPTKTLKPSQRCPNCWEVKPKTLAERLHQCPCGCIEDRDVASAKVCLLWATGLGTSLDKRGSQASTGKPTAKHARWIPASVGEEASETVGPVRH